MLEERKVVQISPHHDPTVAALAQQVDTWLQPLAGSPSGENLEYDIEFLQFSLAAEGKPETQFSAAEPPVWQEVQSAAESLLVKSRDLRVVVPWSRAVVNQCGIVVLPHVLRLFHGLLDTFWDSLHPELDPDDGDAFGRIALTNTLSAPDGLLGDVRNAPLMAHGRLLKLRLRDVEVALGRLAARPGDDPLTLGQIQGMLGDYAELALAAATSVESSLHHLDSLQRVMSARFGIERAVDLKPLRAILQDLRGVLPDLPLDEPPPSGLTGESANDDRTALRDDLGGQPSRPGPIRIESREEALRAIQLVCEYLERHEPTNPAQLMLRRAQRLIDMNFLRLVREFAPDAMGEVARIMGVDPDSIRSQD